MRGKFAVKQRRQARPSHASMRPAHYAREVQAHTGRAMPSENASMRPAHYAREVITYVSMSRTDRLLQ